jgi:hypothetical protein
MHKCNSGWHRYLMHQAQVIRLYVRRRLGDEPQMDPFALEAEWVRLYAADFRQRFGRYAGL